MSLSMWMWTRVSSSSPAAFLLESRRGSPRRRRQRGRAAPPPVPCCRAIAALSTDAIRDAAAAVAAIGGGYSLVRAFEALAERNVIDQKLSRKAVHVLSGVLFMSSWPLFSASMGARYFAAIVPLVNCVRLIVNGLSITNNDGLVKSVSRGGRPEELLRGPLYYVLVLLLCVLVFWRDSPVGITSLAMMCGGDGCADVIGRKFGAVKLPYNDQKSWAGSIAMFLSGSFVSIIMLYYFSSLGLMDVDWRAAVEKVALVSLAATVVESLPLTDVIDDNVAVPFTSMLTALVVFR